MKKILALLLPMFLLPITSCGGNKKEEGNPDYTLDEYTFNTIYSSGDIVTLDKYNPLIPQANGCHEYIVNKDVGNKNYFRISLTTNVNLVGYIYYHDSTNPETKDSEKFYIEKEDTEFTMFLDAYRIGAFATYPKFIEKVTLQNVSDTEVGSVCLKSLGFSDRSMDGKAELFINNDTIRFGTSFVHGGCIKHLERTDMEIREYINRGGDMVIDKDVDPESTDIRTLVSENVNLVNIFDLGREIQPSYYLEVDQDNGHCPKTENIYGKSAIGASERYNPIQCGSAGYKSPQIVEYIYKPDHIYIKCLAQDWFYENDQCDGYIVSDYSFGDDGVLIVRNSFTNFSQYYNLEDVPVSGQECPATYFTYPLNYFYAETKQGVIFDSKVSAVPGNEAKMSKNASVSGDYYYALKGSSIKNSWVAYTNENKFGVGIFMPNCDNFIASRGAHSNNYRGDPQNCSYSATMFPEFNKSDTVPSFMASNYDYVNPQVIRKMIDFVPLKYDYALYVGDVEDMRDTFQTIRDEGIITNDALLDENGWPKK